MKNKRLVNISSRAFMVVCLVVLMTGCFDDRKAMFEHQLLEWEPINRATNTLSTNVSLEIDEVEDKTIHLRMQYAGPHVSHAVTGRFDLLPAESTAVEGKHFQINGQKALTVPPQSSHSNEVELVILSGAIENGEDLTIVLRILDDSDVPPMENYRDFVININKKAPAPPPNPNEVINVTLDRPGTNGHHRRMLDVITGDTYSFTEANNEPALRSMVDFAIFRSGAAGLMLISTGDTSPGSSDGIGRFNGGRTIRDEWQVKNDGDFMRLPASWGDTQAVFDQVSNEQDVLDVFTTTQQWINSLSPAKHPTLVGPTKFLQDRVDGSEELLFTTGDLILFKSITRGVHMIGLVLDAYDDPDDASNRYISIAYKRAIINQ